MSRYNILDMYIIFQTFQKMNGDISRPCQLRSCLGLLYLERRGSVFYRLDSFVGGLVVAAVGGLVQYSRDHGWE